MKVRLGDVCDILNGFSFKSDKYVKEGIRIIRIANVQKGYVEDDDPVYYPLDSSGLEKYMLEEDDLLISLTGNVGRVALLQKDMLPAALNQCVACLRLKNNVLTKGFLFHVLNSNLFEQRCIHSSKGVAQKNMSTEWLKNYEIPLYSIEKQLKITKILDNVKQIINSRQKELSDLDTLIKARFVEMFGDPVLNSFGWCRVSLSEVTSKIGSGATPKGGKESYRSEGISLIRSMNVHDGKFKYKDLAHITEKQAKQLNNVIVEENDVLVNITGASIARTCVVPKNVLPARVNQHVAIIRCDCEQVQPVFLNNLFLNIRFKKMLLSMGENGGATRQAITKQQLENMDVIVPPLSLQNEFAAFVQQIDKLRFGGRKRLTKAKNTKNNNRNTITLERSTLYGK